MRMTSTKTKVFTVAIVAIFWISLLTIMNTRASGSQGALADGSVDLRELQSYYDQGRYETLIANAQAGLNQNPNNADLLIALATTYAMKGSVEYDEAANAIKAISYCDQILELDPSNSEAYRIKAYAYEIQELYDQAHQNYDQAIELNPQNYQALSNKGHAYDLQGDLAKAEEFYLRSLNIQPESEHLLVNLGRLYFRQGKFEKAKSSLASLISIGTNLNLKAGAYQIYSEIWQKEGNSEMAQYYINKALELAPNLPQAWVTRGNILIHTFFNLSSEQEQSALAQEVQNSAEQALSINPRQATAYSLLSKLMLLKNDQAKSAEYKELALNNIDTDITLGAKEKNALRNILNVKIVRR